MAIARPKSTQGFKGRAPKAKQTPLLWVIGGLVVAGAIAATYWVLKTKSSSETPEHAVNRSTTPKGTIMEVSPAKPTVEYMETANEEKHEEPVFTDGRTSEWSKKFSKDSKWSCTTNTLGEIVEVVHDGGKTHKRRSLSKPPLFDGQIDQAIALVVANNPDDPIPPFPVRKFTDAEVRAALKREIKIDPDEPYELQLKKADVINAREEVKRLLDQGMSFEEIIRRSREEQNDNVDIRRQVIQEIKGMLDSGDAEGAEEYRKKANEILRDRGINEIPASGK